MYEDISTYPDRAHSGSDEMVVPVNTKPRYQLFISLSISFS